MDIQVIRKLYEEDRLGVREVAERLGAKPWTIYRLMQQANITRRRGSDQNYATYKTKPQFAIKSTLSPQDEQLRIAGTMLYWAEGTKTGVVVSLANSDPELIAVFIRFLRQVCGVAESRLRILLYAYEDQDVESLKAFWSRVTQIPLTQFSKPYIRPLTANLTHRKMQYGLIQLRYADKRLLDLLHRWTSEFACVWAGAGVANRISL